MPQFRWKGRTTEGREVQGTLASRSKDEVVASLRRQGVLVSSIEERAGEDGLQPEGMRRTSGGLPVPGVAARLAHARDRGPRRVRGLVGALAFIAIGGAIGLLAPVLTCRCERPADGVATCTLDERDLGLIPLRTQTLVGVRTVDAETVTPGGLSNHGRTETIPRVRFVLHGSGRESIHVDRWGDAALRPLRTDLVSWLLEERPGVFVQRSIQWTALWIAAIPILLGLLMAVATLLSFSRRVNDRVYSAAAALAAGVDAQRKRRGPPGRD